ncbi:hypothetical protein ACWDUC_06160 [Streptomyces tricolor]
MTVNEILFLIYGVLIGAQAMESLHAYWAHRDACRSRTAAETARRRAAGERYLASLRLYQLRQRSRG